MTDITTKEDVRLLVETFYQRLGPDPVVGHFFTGLDLSHHLPRIRAFWEMVLLGEPGYTTNVTEVHLALNKRIPMEPAHFERWLELFTATVDEHFRGTNADMAKERARSIGAVMAWKVRSA